MLDMNLWRSILFVPAVQDRFIESALKQQADVLQIDLEDSVAPDQKDLARERVREIAARFRSAGYGVAVRINRPWRMAIRDIEESVCRNVDVLTLPKVPDASYIKFVSEVVDECEARSGLEIGSTRLIAMIEDPEGLSNMEEIAMAGTRLFGLIVGAEDLAVSMRMGVSEDALYVPNVLAVAACRRAGVKPIGFVGSVADFDDTDRFRSTIRRARLLGFDAAFCIHPRQVEVVNDEFKPQLAEVEQARQLIETFENALADGRATCRFGGRMVDLPVAQQARQLIQRHEAYL